MEYKSHVKDANGVDKVGFKVSDNFSVIGFLLQIGGPGWTSQPTLPWCRCYTPGGLGSQFTEIARTTQNPRWDDLIGWEQKTRKHKIYWIKTDTSSVDIMHH